MCEEDVKKYGIWKLLDLKKQTCKEDWATITSDQIYRILVITFDLLSFINSLTIFVKGHNVGSDQPI